MRGEGRLRDIAFLPRKFDGAEANSLGNIASGASVPDETAVFSKEFRFGQRVEAPIARKGLKSGAVYKDRWLPRFRLSVGTQGKEVKPMT